MAQNKQDPQGKQQAGQQKEEQSGDWKATGPGSSEPTSSQATGNSAPHMTGGSVPGSQETMRGGMAGDHKLSDTTAQQSGQQGQDREAESGSTGDIEDSELERRNPKEDTGI